MRDTGEQIPLLNDGCERARSVLEPQIRAEVEAEFVDRWNASGLIRRWFLQRKMEAEIEKRLEEKAPAEALY